MATHMLRKCLRQGCRKFSRHQTRKYSSSVDEASNNSIITNTLMSERPSGFPMPNFVNIDKCQYETQVTTLENGLRVASQKQFGQFCSVGVVIDSGSRYEVNFPSGVSHMLEKLAFTKTKHYENKDKMHEDLEEVGGICDCQGSRDTLIYAISSLTSGLPVAMNILSEVVNQPIIDDTQLQFARATVGYELEAHRMNPVPDTLLTEKLFAAAFRNNTLGLPKLCPEENINVIDERTLYTYMKLFHNPSRMVLSGVGMDHEELVRLAQEYFVDKKPIWEEKQDLIDPSKERDNSIAQYTGGIVTEAADLSSVGHSLTQMPENAHFVIGLESCSHKSPEFVTFCVLNMLMGGGGSFSAGGPGKGMYTRLYTHVLNCFHWINSATAYNHAFEDTGMFCIHSSCPPKALSSLVEVLTKELVNMTGKIKKEEMNRAKTQLQSMLLMNLEQRPVVFEDIGRQVLSTGVRKPAEHYYNLIGEVTIRDIQTVVDKMLRSKPAVAAYGKIEGLPSLDNIQAKLLERPSLKSKLRSRFG